MDWGVITRKINLNDREEVEEVRTFLAEFDLTYSPDEVEYTLAFLKEDEIFATGSIQGNILRNIAISDAVQGQGISATLISMLLQEQAMCGRFHNFVYTKVSSATMFRGLGFSEVAKAEPFVVLLESGTYSVGKYCKELVAKVGALEEGETRASLVMNCNPFTLGHQALVKKAAAENDSVVLFVVSEDLSKFPFKERMHMVEKGVEQFANVKVVAGGAYIISNATFPTYFTHGADTAYAQTRLDAEIFGKHIAKALGITKRYVGSEPLDVVTNEYNTALLEVLPKHGVSVEVMTRITEDLEVISASAVRAALAEKDWETVVKLVPQTTLGVLQSEALEKVIASL